MRGRKAGGKGAERRPGRGHGAAVPGPDGPVRDRRLRPRPHAPAVQPAAPAGPPGRGGKRRGGGAGGRQPRGNAVAAQGEGRAVHGAGRRGRGRSRVPAFVRQGVPGGQAGGDVAQKAGGHARRAPLAHGAGRRYLQRKHLCGLPLLRQSACGRALSLRLRAELYVLCVFGPYAFPQGAGAGQGHRGAFHGGKYGRDGGRGDRAGVRGPPEFRRAPARAHAGGLCPCGAEAGRAQNGLCDAAAQRAGVL